MHPILPQWTLSSDVRQRLDSSGTFSLWRILSKCSLPDRSRHLRTCGVRNLLCTMGKLKTLHCFRPSRVSLMLLTLVCLFYLLNYFSDVKTDSKLHAWVVDPSHRKLMHQHTQSILTRQCRPQFVRNAIKTRLNSSWRVTDHFLWRDTVLTEDMFQYPPPFGLRDMRGKLTDILNLLPTPAAQVHLEKACQRCVVVGNGGILRGMELGPLIDQFDVIIRLNSGPMQGFCRDVGNRTSIRMSYPEGSPKKWEDPDPRLLFVAVVFKSVDFSWLKAMITKKQVSFWDWLFFWQKVPDRIPLELSQFRILNPDVVRETALDLLHLPTPQSHIWGWDKNVPTLGVTALNLASYLCDEVSLAGFGYDLTQKGMPLHYYDSLPMTTMLMQTMHDVAQETALLKGLVQEGVISDLTGAVHCSFCSS
ncbi:lactosylceramide alpha-2,3-sialyltransferase isoform X1 [Paramormyrops kingsleyae]|uniref:lactosylceramide alpha-2,3-sialyltransferase isoform X1 n=2 Tax=Paramormyrops kingsleyae TaxID=1676925 RepID=UPI003B970CBA